MSVFHENGRLAGIYKSALKGPSFEVPEFHFGGAISLYKLVHNNTKAINYTSYNVGWLWWGIPGLIWIRPWCFFDKYDLQPEVPHWGFCEIAPSGWFPIPEAKRLVFGWFFAWWKRTLPIMKMIQESLKRRKQQNFSANITRWIGMDWNFLRKIHRKVPGFYPNQIRFADPWKFQRHGRTIFPIPPRLTICSDSLSSDGVSGMQSQNPCFLMVRHGETLWRIHGWFTRPKKICCFENSVMKWQTNSGLFRNSEPQPMEFRLNVGSQPDVLLLCCKFGIAIITIRRKFRSQTSDNMDRWKAEQGRGREKRKIRRKKSRRERVRRKKLQMREKVGKSRNTVFPMIWGSGGSKVGSLKRRVRSQLARWEMKNCTPLWREAHFQVKMYKTLGVRTTFGSWDVEKVHAVVARSTFPSENVQSTPFSDHFWKLRCRKSARRCGAKHISKSKCAKHTMYGPFLEVQMSKRCTPSWREAHFQVKMYKTHHVRTIFGGSDVVPRGRCKALWTLSKVSKTWVFWSIFNYNHHYITRHSNTIHYTTTTTTPSLHSTTLHYTTLHSITLNYTQLHDTTLHYTTLHYTTPRYTTRHYTTLRYITLHYPSTTLHYTTLHSTTLQLHYTTFHYTPPKARPRVPSPVEYQTPKASSSSVRLTPAAAREAPKTSAYSRLISTVEHQTAKASAASSSSSSRPAIAKAVAINSACSCKIKGKSNCNLECWRGGRTVGSNDFEDWGRNLQPTGSVDSVIAASHWSGPLHLNRLSSGAWQVQFVETWKLATHPQWSLASACLGRAYNSSFRGYVVCSFILSRRGHSTERSPGTCWITLHYTQLHYTTLHSTTFHYTTLHNTALHYIPLHYTTLHWMTLHHR